MLVLVCHALGIRNGPFRRRLGISAFENRQDVTGSLRLFQKARNVFLAVNFLRWVWVWPTAHQGQVFIHLGADKLPQALAKPVA